MQDKHTHPQIKSRRWQTSRNALLLSCCQLISLVTTLLLPRTLSLSVLSYHYCCMGITKIRKQLLVDVFVLPLERWAAELEALRDADSGRAEPLVPDLTQDGKVRGVSAMLISLLSRYVGLCMRGTPNKLTLSYDMYFVVFRTTTVVVRC